MHETDFCEQDIKNQNKRDLKERNSVKFVEYEKWWEAKCAIVNGIFVVDTSQRVYNKRIKFAILLKFATHYGNKMVISFFAPLFSSMFTGAHNSSGQTFRFVWLCLCSREICNSTGI